MIATDGITADNIESHEFTGLQMQVTYSPNRFLVGLNGSVTHETKSMITLATKHGGTKHVPKKWSRLRFSRGDKEIGEVDGNTILKRPFERSRR